MCLLSEVLVNAKTIASRPYFCLLHKPTRYLIAICLIPYCRPTRASVLSGYIDSVTVAAIIYHAPQCINAVSRYLIESLLPYKADRVLQALLVLYS